MAVKKEPARSARQRVAAVITATKAQGGNAARKLNSACHGVRAKNCLEDFSANPSGQQHENKACGYEVGEHGSLRLVRSQIDFAHVPPAPAGEAQKADHDECDDVHGSKPLARVVVKEAVQREQYKLGEVGRGVGDAVHWSDLRLLAFGGLDQFRPNALPVIGAQVLTRYRAFGGLLKKDRQFRRAWAKPIHDVLQVAQCGCALFSQVLAGLRLHVVDVRFQVHA